MRLPLKDGLTILHCMVRRVLLGEQSLAYRKVAPLREETSCSWFYMIQEASPNSLCESEHEFTMQYDKNGATMSQS